MTSRRNHQVLSSSRCQRVGHGGGVSGSWKLAAPEFFSRLDVEGTDVRVRDPGDENQSSRRGDGAAETNRSGRYRRIVTFEVFHRAKRNLPANFSFGHIHRDERPPWRGAARQMRRRLEKSPNHAVGRTRLWAIIPFLVVRFNFLARNQPHFGGKIIGVGYEQAALGIEGVSAPGHAADVSR